MENWYLGIDLGGTNIKMGLVDQKGTLRRKVEFSTNTTLSARQVIEEMVSHAQQLAGDKGPIRGIGIGLPGFLDRERGLIKSLTNLGWKQIPIRDWLEDAFDCPVVIDNDANVAAFGEVWRGAGQGKQNVVCLTLGTGVGGGVILNGQLVHGHNDSAGEIGHIVIDPQGLDCNCGKRGCLETFASATGMRNHVQFAKKAGKSTILSDQATPAEIFQAAKNGDPLAQEIVQMAISALGRALATISVIINPERFVIGGGISQAGDQLFLPLRRAYQEMALEFVQDQVDIVPAKLGTWAGVIGAAGLVALED